jgi:hypothetical protein
MVKFRVLVHEVGQPMPLGSENGRKPLRSDRSLDGGGKEALGGIELLSATI